MSTFGNVLMYHFVIEGHMAEMAISAKSVHLFKYCINK